MSFNPCAAFKANIVHRDLRRQCTDRPRAQSVNESAPQSVSAPTTPCGVFAPTTPVGTPKLPGFGGFVSIPGSSPESESPNNSGRSTPTQWSLGNLAQSLSFKPIRSSSWSGGRPAFLSKRLRSFSVNSGSEDEEF